MTRRRIVARTPLLQIATVAFWVAILTAAVSCSVERTEDDLDGDRPRDSSFADITVLADSGDYIEAIDPSLGAIAKARFDFNEAAAAETGGEFVSASDMLDLAEAARTAFTDALDVVSFVVPPAECESAHSLLIESLQYSERGLIELTSYFRQIEETGSADESLRLEGNELTADGERVKVQMIAEMERSGCGADLFDR